jgi:hypothetical protein
MTQIVAAITTEVARTHKLGDRLSCSCSLGRARRPAVRARFPPIDRFLLWPIRLQHVCDSGQATGNADAVDHYLKLPDAANRSLSRKPRSAGRT